MFQSKKELAKRVAKTAIFAGVAITPMAFAAGEIEAGLTELQTTIQGYIGLAIVAALALMAASLAPDVGMSLIRKWVKKGAK